MKLAYFIPLKEYSSKVLTTILSRFKPQTTDSEEQIIQNMKRFEQLSGAISQKFQQQNPAVVRAIPQDLQQNSRFRDITQYKNYDDLIRVLKSVEKKDIDIYKQAIEYYKKTSYHEPRVIGIYVGRFKQILPQLKQAIEDKNEDILSLLPKGLRSKEAENILNYRKFEDLEHLIDGGFAMTSDEKGETNDAETDADLVYKGSNGIEIYKGDSEHKCIRYGAGEYYGWCISRQRGSLYGSYRFINSDKMFYFVFDREASDKKSGGTFVNPYHVVVIHVDSKGKYTRSIASNNGDAPYGGCKWSELGDSFSGAQGQEMWNKIKGLEKYFPYIPPSSEERKAHGFKNQSLTLDQFIDLPIEDKQAWLRINAGDRNIIKGDIIRSLDNNQINDLINHNRKFSFEELDGNRPLLKRYADYRYTRFPKEALPPEFIPYLKPELQNKYFDEFQEEYLTFDLIEKYCDKEIIDKYIKQQISRLGYLPKEAMKYMDPKQKFLYQTYSIAQSQFKNISGKAAETRNVVGTVQAPQQDFILNTPSAEYLKNLDEKETTNFVDLVKKIKPQEKYIEFVYGVPTCFEYKEKLYFYTPKNQNDDELDSDSEWCIVNQNGQIEVDQLYNKSEEGLRFYLKGNQYTTHLGAEDYLVGSQSIPLKAGIDFDTLEFKTLNDKKQSFSINNLDTVLKEEKIEDNWFAKKLQFRAGIN